MCKLKQHRQVRLTEADAFEEDSYPGSSHTEDCQDSDSDSPTADKSTVTKGLYIHVHACSVCMGGAMW